MTEQNTMNDPIWQAVAEERATLVEMLRELPESAWDTASLCAGWRIRDVVAHLVLATRVTVAALVVSEDGSRLATTAWSAFGWDRGASA